MEELTVKDLVEALQQFPPDLPIKTAGGSWGMVAYDSADQFVKVDSDVEASYLCMIVSAGDPDEPTQG